MTEIFVVLSKHNPYALIEQFNCFSLKAIEFIGFDNTGFHRFFVVLMYLCIFIDILKSYGKKFHAVKK